MRVERARDRATLDENAYFHVLLHRMACQVGAGYEADVLIGNGDFGVNASARVLTRFSSPSENVGVRQCSFHLAEGVE
jgi:hypothetical protein